MNYYKVFKKFLKENYGISIAEWHSLVIGASTALIAGIQLFTLILTAALGVKKSMGHLGDLKKEIGYGLTSFTTIEGIQWLISIL